MCFSETQSYINAILLFFVGLHKISEWRIGIPLIFLGTKDLLQGFLYKYLNNSKLLNFYSILSWVHLCFQPLFVNIFGSYFDINLVNKNDKKSKEKTKNFWYFVYFINIAYAIAALFSLKDINKFKNDCMGNAANNYCQKETSSYMGKYHIAYQFNLNNNKFLFEIIYKLLYIIPGIFSRSSLLYILWFLFYYIIFKISKILKLRNGEASAIWCFMSIIFGIPVALFSKQILEILRKLNNIIKKNLKTYFIKLI